MQRLIRLIYSSLLRLRTWIEAHPVRAVILGGLAVTCIRFLPLFFGKTLIFGDNYSLLVPGKLFTAHWLEQGVLPLWNPLLFSGISWIGDVSQSLVYPSTVLFVLFSPATALNGTVLFHYLLTFFGMYLLARAVGAVRWLSFLAAVLWANSSIFTGSINNLATLQSLAWFPLVLWASVLLPRKKYFTLVLGVLFSLQFLAGYPQHLLLTGSTGFLFSVMFGRDRTATVRFFLQVVFKWCAAGVLAVALTAFALFPFIQTLLTSTRVFQSAEQAGSGSLEPLEFIKLLVPYFFDLPLWGVRWGPSWNGFPTAVPYITAIGLLTLGFSWKAVHAFPWRWVVLGICATVLLSLGENLPAFASVLNAIPFLAAVRYPSAWLSIALILLILLFAHSFPAAKIPRRLLQLLACGAGFVSIASVIGLGAVMLWFPSIWTTADALVSGKLSASVFHTVERDQSIAILVLSELSVLALLFLVAAWALLQRRLALFALVVLADSLIHSQGLLFYAPADAYRKPAQLHATAQALSLQDPQGRVLLRNFNVPYTDFGAYWEALVVRAPFSDSFVTPEELVTYEELQRRRDELTPNWNTVAGVPIVNGYTTLLPADYQKRFEGRDEARINALSELDIHNPLLQKWAVNRYVVDTWYTVEDDYSYLNVVAQSGWSTVYELPALPRVRYPDGTPVVWEQFAENPNQIQIVFENPGQTEVVIADRHEPGWVATVNGTPVEVRERSGMRVIPIEEGKNSIDLRYKPREFVWGAALSLAAWASLSVVLLAMGVRRVQAARTLK